MQKSEEYPENLKKNVRFCNNCINCGWSKRTHGHEPKLRINDPDKNERQRNYEHSLNNCPNFVPKPNQRSSIRPPNGEERRKGISYLPPRNLLPI
jgi:hypothetical protein